jgi:hypothetical protein
MGQQRPEVQMFTAVTTKLQVQIKSESYIATNETPDRLCGKEFFAVCDNIAIGLNHNNYVTNITF